MYLCLALAVLLNIFLAINVAENSQPALVPKHSLGTRAHDRRVDKHNRRLPENAPCLLPECIQQEGASLARAFPDRSNKAWKLHEDRNTTAEEKYKHYGLLYAKVPKTASSTAAAVALRIARKHSVSVAYDHSWPIEHDYGNRHPTQSFLWASIRDPAQRAVSYLSDQASRKQQEQSGIIDVRSLVRELVLQLLLR
jgi:hypothetical protein